MLTEYSKLTKVYVSYQKKVSYLKLVGTTKVIKCL